MPGKLSKNFDQEKSLFQHSAFNNWLRLLPAVKVPNRIELVEESIPGRIVYRLVGVGDNGSNVIAKRTPQGSSHVERTIYEEILPNMPLPMLNYYGSIKDEESGYYWLFLEDVSGKKYQPHIVEHRVAAAKWLGIMNTFSSNQIIASNLPDRSPDHYLMLLKTGRDSILSKISNLVLRPEDLRIMEAVVVHCDYLNFNWTELTSGFEKIPKTLVHGDFISKNVGIRTSRDGITILPFDWEKAGWGSPAEDISLVDIDTYWNTVRDSWPDIDLQIIKHVAYIGRFFRCLVYLEWIVTQMSDNSIEEYLHHLKQCESWLTELIHLLPGQKKFNYSSQ